MAAIRVSAMILTLIAAAAVLTAAVCCRPCFAPVPGMALDGTSMTVTAALPFFLLPVPGAVILAMFPQIVLWLRYAL